MKNKKLILIGSSTGGPGHLEQILASLDASFNATIIIAQHIDSIFLPSMIKRFNDICSCEVLQAIENHPLKPNTVYFTSKNITRLKSTSTQDLIITKCIKTSHYQPSVNSLFFSASELDTPYNILVCLLTGIGDDGAEGMLSLKNNGAQCIAEAEESSIVFGMPKVAFDIGASTKVMRLDKIIEEIKKF